MKNKWILRDFLQKRKSWVQSWQPRTSAFCDFSSPPVASSHEKLMSGHTKCCTCHAKSSQQTYRSDAPAPLPLSGNQRPDLLTSLMNMSFVLRLPRDMHLWKSSSNVPCLPSLLEMLQNPHVLLTFDKVHNPLRLPRESTSERPKVHFWLGNVLRATTACTFSTHSSWHPIWHFIWHSILLSIPEIMSDMSIS